MGLGIVADVVERHVDEADAAAAYGPHDVDVDPAPEDGSSSAL